MYYFTHFILVTVVETLVKLGPSEETGSMIQPWVRRAEQWPLQGTRRVYCGHTSTVFHRGRGHVIYPDMVPVVHIKWSLFSALHCKV